MLIMSNCVMSGAATEIDCMTSYKKARKHSYLECDLWCSHRQTPWTTAKLLATVMHTWLITKSISERQDLEIAVYVYHFMQVFNCGENGDWTSASPTQCKTDGLHTSNLNTPGSSWNLAATQSSSSIWCSPECRRNMATAACTTSCQLHN